MKNKSKSNRELSQTVKIGREIFTVDIDGNVTSTSQGELGHTEDIIDTAKWFHELFMLMSDIEDGLTDQPTDIS